MVNRKLFAQQVMYLLEQDTYLRVSYVSSKLMVKDCILKKELKLYSGNAYEYLYSRF